MYCSTSLSTPNTTLPAAHNPSLPVALLQAQGTWRTGMCIDRAHPCCCSSPRQLRVRPGCIMRGGVKYSAADAVTTMLAWPSSRTGGYCGGATTLGELAQHARCCCCWRCCAVPEATHATAHSTGHHRPHTRLGAQQEHAQNQLLGLCANQPAHLHITLVRCLLQTCTATTTATAWPHQPPTPCTLSRPSQLHATHHHSHTPHRLLARPPTRGRAGLDTKCCRVTAPAPAPGGRWPPLTPPQHHTHSSARTPYCSGERTGSPLRRCAQRQWQVVLRVLSPEWAGLCAPPGLPPDLKAASTPAPSWWW